jgi:hypothetical protein
MSLKTTITTLDEITIRPIPEYGASKLKVTARKGDLESVVFGDAREPYLETHLTELIKSVVAGLMQQESYRLAKSHPTTIDSH